MDYVITMPQQPYENNNNKEMHKRLTQLTDLYLQMRLKVAGSGMRDNGVGVESKEETKWMSHMCGMDALISCIDSSPLITSNSQ